MQEEEETQICSNCNQQIPESKHMLHELYCARNCIQCPDCYKFYDKNDPEAHQEEFHKKINCEFCNKEVNELHSCSQKPIKCKHCKVEQQRNVIIEHEQKCGSRTKNCEICNKIVLVRNIDEHERRCQESQIRKLNNENSKQFQNFEEQFYQKSSQQRQQKGKISILDSNDDQTFKQQELKRQQDQQEFYREKEEQRQEYERKQQEYQEREMRKKIEEQKRAEEECLYKQKKEEQLRQQQQEQQQQEQQRRYENKYRDRDYNLDNKDLFQNRNQYQKKEERNQFNKNYPYQQKDNKKPQIFDKNDNQHSFIPSSKVDSQDSSLVSYPQHPQRKVNNYTSPYIQQDQEQNHHKTRNFQKPESREEYRNLQRENKDYGLNHQYKIDQNQSSQLQHNNDYKPKNQSTISALREQNIKKNYDQDQQYDQKYYDRKNNDRNNYDRPNYDKPKQDRFNYDGPNERKQNDRPNLDHNSYIRQQPSSVPSQDPSGFPSQLPSSVYKQESQIYQSFIDYEALDLTEEEYQQQKALMEGLKQVGVNQRQQPSQIDDRRQFQPQPYSYQNYLQENRRKNEQVNRNPSGIDPRMMESFHPEKYFTQEEIEEQQRMEMILNEQKNQRHNRNDRRENQSNIYENADEEEEMRIAINASLNQY